MDEFDVEKINSKELTACVYTFSKSQDNYGQVLQYLATQEFLESQNIHSFLIRDKYNGLTRRQYIKSKIAHYIKLLWRRNRVAEAKKRFMLKESRKHPRRFDDFRSKYFRIIDVGYVKKDPPHADLYIAGSDQIWNYPTYLPYLDWGDAVRMSFSTSFGKLLPDNTRLIEKIKPLLQKIDIVTVREDIGLEICHKAGVHDATRILDPTLLLNANDYFKYESNVNLPAQYVFLYMIGNETQFDVKVVYDFAKTKNMPVVYVASKGWHDKFPKEYPTISEWLYIMRNASYVFTNSFHGVAFSIIYHKQFVSIPLTGRDRSTNNRVDTLLNYCHIEDKVYKGNLNVIDVPIDYAMVDNHIMDNYNYTIKFVNKAKGFVANKC